MEPQDQTYDHEYEREAELASGENDYRLAENCQHELYGEKTKLLSELQHRMARQLGHGKIKTVEGCGNMINDQILIMRSEVEFKYKISRNKIGGTE